MNVCSYQRTKRNLISNFVNWTLQYCHDVSLSISEHSARIPISQAMVLFHYSNFDDLLWKNYDRSRVFILQADSYAYCNVPCIRITSDIALFSSEQWFCEGMLNWVKSLSITINFMDFWLIMHLCQWTFDNFLNTFTSIWNNLVTYLLHQPHQIER